MPGRGYFTQRSESDPAFARWASPPQGFDPDTGRWELMDLIKQHQASVFARKTWPSQL